MRSVTGFDTFLAGAACFVAGVALTLALDVGPRTGRDTFLVLATLAGLAYGATTLRRLYVAQRRRDPAARAEASA